MSTHIHPQVGSRDFEQLSPTSSAQRRLKRNNRKRKRESKPKGKNTSVKSDKEPSSFLEAVTKELDACQAELAATLKLKARDKNILEVLKTAGGFDAFVSLVSTVPSLKEALEDGDSFGPFTVFGEVSFLSYYSFMLLKDSS